MRDDKFKVEFLTGGKADVYLSCPEGSQLSWQLVRLLDEASIRVVGDQPGPYTNCDRMRRIMAGCSGVVSTLAYHPCSRTIDSRLLSELRHGAALGLPLALFLEKDVDVDLDEDEDQFRLRFNGSEPVFIRPDRLHGPAVYLDDVFDRDIHATVDRFQSAVLRNETRVPSYAFLVGRLEKDFAQAREAILTAVENEAGIPCLWADDGRHLTNIASVRESTRLLIEHSSFVIADLTLGTENPDHENPSRAHEIGMAIAYERHIMLCSKEPRRYPYFSVGDMQMTFWTTEAELSGHVREWIRTHDVLRRQVFNHRLGEIYPGYKAQIEQPVFDFDPTRRYVGPTTAARSSAGVPFTLLVSAVVLLLLVVALLAVALATGSR
jgi:hypothetical protein